MHVYAYIHTCIYAYDIHPRPTTCSADGDTDETGRACSTLCCAFLRRVVSHLATCVCVCVCVNKIARERGRERGREREGERERGREREEERRRERARREREREREKEQEQERERERERDYLEQLAGVTGIRPSSTHNIFGIRHWHRSLQHKKHVCFIL